MASLNLLSVYFTRSLLARIPLGIVGLGFFLSAQTSVLAMQALEKDGLSSEMKMNQSTQFLHRPDIRIARGGSHKQKWGRPRKRTSGGGRDLCNAPLIAVIPGQGNLTPDIASCGKNSDSEASATTMRSPTLWFYVPDLSRSDVMGEIVLLKDGVPVYEELQPLPATGGVLPIQFNYALEPDIWYDWQFSLVIEPNYPTENPTVESSIQYVPSESMASVTPSSSPILSQEYSLDSLHSIAQSYCINPLDQTLKQRWLSMLQAIDLAGLYPASLIGCKTSLIENEQFS